MSGAKTLFQLAGATLPAPGLADSAIIVIDAQREYVDGLVPLEGIAPALDALARLLAVSRAAGTPVIHIAHRGKEGAGGPFDPAGPGFAFAAEATPVPGEAVIEKGLPNAFAGTTLLEAFRATGRKSAILAGFMTHMCVSTTARAALDLGVPAFVASDATATRALPDPDGGADIPAAVVHRAALAEIADRFAVVVPVAKIIA